MPGVARLDRWVTRTPRRRFWITVIAAGLAIRLLLAPWTGGGDLATYAESATSLGLGGGPYTYLLVYPPGFVDLLALAGRIAGGFLGTPVLVGADPGLLRFYATSSLQWTGSLATPTFALVEKLPLFLLDLGAAGLAYLLVRECADERRARWALVGLFWNPLLLFLSAVPGEFDILPAFLVLAAVYLAMHGRGLSSGAALGLGAAIKLFPLFFLPLVLAILWRRGGPIPSRRAVPVSTALVGAAAVLTWVFLPLSTARAYLGSLFTGPTVGQSHGGFGLWSWVQLPHLTPVNWWFFWNTAPITTAMEVVAVGLALAVALLYLARRPKEGIDPVRTFGAATLTGLATLLTMNVVEPQYLIWILPWLVITAAVTEHFRWSLVAVTAAGLGFLLFGLGGPLYWLEPVAVFTPYLSWGAFTQNLAAWAPTAALVAPICFVVGALALAYVGVRAVRGLTRAGGVA
ncbi:MAG: glycosyltransferase 87 family protein [Thermoplasmata archaeon]